MLNELYRNEIARDVSRYYFVTFKCHSLIIVHGGSVRIALLAPRPNSAIMNSVLPGFPIINAHSPYPAVFVIAAVCSSLLMSALNGKRCFYYIVKYDACYALGPRH